MTYHINLIINNSSKSIAIVNPAPNPDGRDSRIYPTGKHEIANPVKVNFIKTSGTITYTAALPTAINVYTFKDNTFFWDNGNSAINGVAQSNPNSDLNLYNGSGGDLTLTIDANGNLSFSAS
jgi:hypothetical protein